MASRNQLQLSACGIPSKSFGGSGAKQLEHSWNRTFLALGFGGFTPQLQVFMWHLDGKPRCKGGLVDHGCILVINAVLNKKTFWSYSLWQYLSLYAHGADGSCRKKPNAKAHLANLPMKRWAFRWDLAGLWSETKDSTALSQFFWLVAHYSFGQKDFCWIHLPVLLLGSSSSLCSWLKRAVSIAHTGNKYSCITKPGFQMGQTMQALKVQIQQQASLGQVQIGQVSGTTVGTRNRIAQSSG